MTNRVYHLLVFLSVYSCGMFGPRVYNWQELPDEYYAIPPFAKYLDSMRIVIDPGHGGQGNLPNYKRGSSGLREAEVNLQVALYLRQFLESSGARVIMTREDDSYIGLKERAEIANTSGAAFMISIHHNAGKDPATNQCSIFYHDDPNSSPASIDLARNLYYGLLEALHLPQLSEDGLYSDNLIYPDGFGLLRTTKIPAVLVESSYFSNPKEEKRLKSKRYNKREAYGIFLGLCRYASGGFPFTRLIKPENGFSDTKKPEIIFKLEDGLRQRQGPDQHRLRIFSNSISVRLDGRIVKHTYLPAEEMISCILDSLLTNGLHTLTVELQNIYKNHNLPHPHNLIIASPCRNIRFHTPLTSFPKQKKGFIPIDIRFSDKDTLPVWEKTRVNIVSPDANIRYLDSLLHEGTLHILAQPEYSTDTICIIAAADSYSDTLKIPRDSTSVGILQGILRSNKDSIAIRDAGIDLNDTLVYKSNEYGIFTITNLPEGFYMTRFQKSGYRPLIKNYLIQKGNIPSDTLYLPIVYDGLLHDRAIILDSNFGKFDQNGDAERMVRDSSISNLVRIVLDSLDWAGAQGCMVKEDGDTLTLSTHIKRINDIRNGWYLGINRILDLRGINAIDCFVYPGNVVAAAIADSIGTVFNVHGFRYRLVPTMNYLEIRNTNKTAVGLNITAGRNITDRQLANWIFSGLKAYYRGLTLSESKNSTTGREEIRTR